METREQWYKPNLLYNIHYRPTKRQEPPKMIVETVRFNPSICTCGEHGCEPQFRMEKRVLWTNKEMVTEKKENSDRSKDKVDGEDGSSVKDDCGGNTSSGSVGSKRCDHKGDTNERFDKDYVEGSKSERSDKEDGQVGDGYRADVLDGTHRSGVGGNDEVCRDGGCVEDTCKNDDGSARDVCGDGRTLSVDAWDGTNQGSVVTDGKDSIMFGCVRRDRKDRRDGDCVKDTDKDDDGCSRDISGSERSIRDGKNKGGSVTDGKDGIGCGCVVRSDSEHSKDDVINKLDGTDNGSSRDYTRGGTDSGSDSGECVDGTIEAEVDRVHFDERSSGSAIETGDSICEYGATSGDEVMELHKTDEQISSAFGIMSVYCNVQ